MNPEKLTALFEQAMSEVKTPEELFEALFAASYAIGGLVCNFEEEGRSPILIKLTEAMGVGLMNTAKEIGQPSDLQMVTGRMP